MTVLIFSIIFLATGVVFFILSKYAADERFSPVGNLVVVEDDDGPYVFLELTDSASINSRYVKLKVIRKKNKHLNDTR